MPIPYSKLNSQPVTPGDAIFALIAGGILLICAGDAQSSQITDERGNTFYTTPSDLEQIPKAATPPTAMAKYGASVISPQTHALSIDHPTRGKRVNTDPANRIPAMTRVPLHHSTPPPSLLSQEARNLIVNSGQRPIVSLQPRSPELYYLERPQFASMEAKSPLVAKQPSVEPAGLAEHFVFKAPLAQKEIAERPSLSFDIEPQADGSYNWAILAPGMSATISAPCSMGAADAIRVDSINASDQAVTLTVPIAAPSKAVNIAIGGFSGGDASERRWYELINLNLAPGHTISAQVNNRGSGLLLQNTGPATAFELRVHYGMNPAMVAVRSSVSLDANMAFHIAPQEWSAASIVNVAIQMTTFNAATGVQIKDAQL